LSLSQLGLGANGTVSSLCCASVIAVYLNLKQTASQRALSVRVIAFLLDGLNVET
jgi:hypothetical protein